MHTLEPGHRTGAKGSEPTVYVQQIAWTDWTFALANPSFYAVLFDGAIPRFQPSASGKHVMTMALEMVVRILQAFMAQGLLPVEDPVMLTRALWAPFHGVVSLYLLGHFSSLEEAKQAFERTAQAMICSFGPGTPPAVS